MRIHFSNGIEAVARSIIIVRVHWTMCIWDQYCLNTSETRNCSLHLSQCGTYMPPTPEPKISNLVLISGLIITRKFKPSIWNWSVMLRKGCQPSQNIALSWQDAGEEEAAKEILREQVPYVGRQESRNLRIWRAFFAVGFLQPHGDAIQSGWQNTHQAMGLWHPERLSQEA